MDPYRNQPLPDPPPRVEAAFCVNCRWRIRDPYCRPFSEWVDYAGLAPSDRRVRLSLNADGRCAEYAPSRSTRVLRLVGLRTPRMILADAPPTPALAQRTQGQ